MGLQVTRPFPSMPLTDSRTPVTFGDFSQVYYMGPSFQFRPMPAFTINFAPLAGFGPDSGDARIYLNLGYEF